MKLRWLVIKGKDKPVLQYWYASRIWYKPRWVDVPFVVETEE